MKIDKVEIMHKAITVKIALALVASVCIYIVLLVISPLIRYYTLAYLGNSEAMYILGRDYFKNPTEIVFFSNGQRGYYWLRRSASRGNLDAIMNIEMGWFMANPKEVVYWLEKGISFGHPWCAEQLARGYWLGLYGLKVDPVKEAEYRAIGKRMRAEGKGSRWDQ